MLPIPDGPRPALHFLPPARRPWLLALGRWLSWLEVKMLGIRGIETTGGRHLVDLYRGLQEGKTRFIVAFRHPSTDDGPLVMRLLCGIARVEAARLGVRLARAPKGYFLYGRDVPEWSGRWLAWLFPRSGAISVFPGQLDSKSLTAIRRCLTEAPHPLALAPEGQVTYHNERVAALEPGTAQIAFWCTEDLRRQGRTEEVFVLPVCFSYHYRESDWKGLAGLLSRIERECGLPPLPSAPDTKPYVRVMRAVRHLLNRAEEHYTRFHGVTFRQRRDDSVDELQRRVDALVEAALGEAERFFRLAPRGDWVQRVLAIRHTGLTWIHREDIASVDALPPLDRMLAERVAAEAWLRLRHMELADVLEYVRLDYLSPDSGIDRYVESVSNLWDVVNRLKGGNISGRGTPFPRSARIEIGEPIPVARFQESYRANRRRGVAELTEEILRVFRQTAERRGGPGGTGRRDTVPVRGGA
jgi:1-acyl-sn-glycerol-3-phosphate acyltransferase